MRATQPAVKGTMGPIRDGRPIFSGMDDNGSISGDNGAVLMVVGNIVVSVRNQSQITASADLKVSANSSSRIVSAGKIKALYVGASSTWVDGIHQ